MVSLTQAKHTVSIQGALREAIRPTGAKTERRGEGEAGKKACGKEDRQGDCQKVREQAVRARKVER